MMEESGKVDQKTQEADSNEEAEMVDEIKV